VICDFPTARDRESILAALSRSLSLAPGVDLATIAAQADGFTGADLQALLSDAQLAAVHRQLDQGSLAGSSMEGGPPQVGMQDLVSQLQSARPSVTAKERHRLTAIYDEFLGSKSRVSTIGLRRTKGREPPWHDWHKHVQVYTTRCYSTVLECTLHLYTKVQCSECT